MKKTSIILFLIFYLNYIKIQCKTVIGVIKKKPAHFSNNDRSSSSYYGRNYKNGPYLTDRESNYILNTEIYLFVCLLKINFKIIFNYF